MRRARPLLGTIVDLQARARDEITLVHGFEAAFAAIERVHRLMSFHDEASDTSRMNSAAFQYAVVVDRWTWRVLQAAQQFARDSDGAFDITVGRLLANWNYLPRHGSPRESTSGWRDIILEKGCVVRFRRPLTIDLGGIAKGFAIDCAVNALKEAGACAGIVNAGGDLRAFGLQKETVRIRYPLDPSRAAGVVTLQNRALATSATYFSRQKCGARVRSALIDGQTQQPFVDDVSVSVAADDCMTADALTKIVFVLRERARPILANHRADAIILERDRTPQWFSYAPRFNQTKPPA